MNEKKQTGEVAKSMGARLEAALEKAEHEAALPSAQIEALLRSRAEDLRNLARLAEAIRRDKRRLRDAEETFNRVLAAIGEEFRPLVAEMELLEGTNEISAEGLRLALGRVASRLVVEDEAAAMEWAEKHDCVRETVKRALDKRKVKRHVEAGQEVPGVRIEKQRHLRVTVEGDAAHALALDEPKPPADESDDDITQEIIDYGAWK